VTPILDTSVVVRYLVQDGREAPVARSIIESDEELLLTPVAIQETSFVLTRLYGLPRELVVDRLLDLIARENVTVHGLDEQVAIDALLLCRPSARVSFADALIWAAARDAGDLPIYSFDARFPNVQVEVRREPV
jgi:predicted nucleic acid-binding protein